MTFNILFPMSPGFKMDLPQASLFLGIIPALILLYIGLKGYEGQYKEKLIFLTFIVGIVAGVVAVLIEAVTRNMGLGFLFMVVLFPVLEQLLKTIILNIGRLQAKKETVIYGLSLGLGFGSVFTPFSLATSRFQTVISLPVIAWISLGSFGIILLQGATGTCIGYGVYTRKLARYVSLAVLFYIPVVFFTSLFQGEYLQIGVVAYGVIIYWYAIKRIMPQILSQSKSRKRSKKIVTNIK